MDVIVENKTCIDNLLYHSNQNIVLQKGCFVHVLNKILICCDA